MNLCFVSMLPAFLLTVITPSATSHPAGCVVSFTERHASRFFPSNKMIASDGGSCGVLPGVITLGTGSHTSVALGSFCASRLIVLKRTNVASNTFFIGYFLIDIKNSIHVLYKKNR